MSSEGDQQNRLVSLEVRAGALEVRADYYDKFLERFDRHMESNTTALNKLVVLEQRHHSLDKAAAKLAEQLSTEVAERKAMEKEIGSQLSNLVSATGLNSHGRDLFERLFFPIMSGCLGALAMWLIQSFGSSPGF